MDYGWPKSCVKKPVIISNDDHENCLHSPQERFTLKVPPVLSVGALARGAEPGS